MKRVFLALSGLAALALAGAALAIYLGVYDISATEQHYAPTYRLLDYAMRRSIKQRAEEIAVPQLDDDKRIRRGAALFRDHCVQCHGGPGVAPEPFALGLTPLAANLAYTGREWPAADIFFVVRNGIKMTGMPAWEFRLGEDELWDVVAFVRAVPYLSPEAYARLVAALPPHVHEHASASAGGAPDPGRGKLALEQYACVTCHRIPGLVGPAAPVGPPLDSIGSRGFIAGILANEPLNMERWLRAPREISPHNAMPDLGVSARDAQDMAAYLATLR